MKRPQQLELPHRPTSRPTPGAEIAARVRDGGIRLEPRVRLGDLRAVRTHN